MTIKLYKAMGALAHELTPVYSELTPATEHYDVVEVDLPEAIYAGKNEIGETLVEIDGTVYRLGEILTCDADDNPALTWYDGNCYEVEPLSLVEQ